MSVVFHRSARKMIFKGLVVTLVFSLAWIKSVTGATSYSNVYVQSGPSLASVYRPAALSGAQLAPLAAAPMMSNLLPPCVSPCVIPSQRIAALAPVATSNANFVTYNQRPPITVPVMVAPANDDAANYEYSYVVYDEDTGDQKAQKELSDGGVVRGQYSLVQPDGYVREVQYTADDLRGFNAIVKNFLPNYALNTASKGKASPPCPEVKNEPLKESSGSQSHEEAKEAHDLEPEAHGEESHQVEPKTEEHETHEEKPEPEAHKEPSEPKELPKPEEQEKTGAGDGHAESAHGEPKKLDEESHGEAEGHSESEGKGELAGPKRTPESVEAHVEPTKQEAPKEQARPEVKPDEMNALVSYNDVIKCIQAAIKGVAPTASPLTYIILNKPC